MTYGRWILEHLMAEEGYRRTPYKDTRGVLTVGIGHRIWPGDAIEEHSELTDQQVRLWFLEDLTVAELAFQRLFGWRGHAEINDARKVALTGMCFQLGEAGVLGFVNMRQAARQGDWPLAAREALDSRWAEQTPARAARVARILDSGTYRKSRN